MKASEAVLNEENLELVKRLDSEDFTSPSFLAELADDVEWWVAGPRDILPFAGTFHGVDEVASWVKVLRENCQYDKWEPVQWLVQGDTVVEIVKAGGRGRKTGRRYESEIVRVWTLREGRVSRVRSYYDTAAYVAALHSQ